MEQFLGISLLGFVIVTFVLFGFCSFMTGQALANGWQKPLKIIPYGALLACGDRFIGYALAGGDLTSVTGFLAAWLVLGLICYAAYRLTLARKMVNQYPWLYQLSGPFSYKSKA
ncbi:MAG TPA: hypothetical protein DFI00_06845 [Rhodospirillaceae bacterium]|nr:hypothetical protein [Alphaproteobacteria bacterium]OUT41816.1 MAG: hypothetical protein CBB62_05765 [Micavibrio sp. TMED2]HCI46992.1 hypothetical protein [Rhodospirillaceae bacterium]MAS46595.1 hypothetical protein [Alphaproteobacteria bacterium]MAX94689.1 hypothetical protein [Alphaproteobacteria bacterium]|tara:strand:- start:6317 stop:6658 length:342 start_codon:yes stop_codon:yes gene_type:complete